VHLSDQALIKSNNNMKIKTTAVFAAITFGLLSISAWAQTVTVLFIPRHDQAFWITNNTDKTLSVTLTKIEVQVGSEWRAYSEPTQPGPGTFYFMHAHSNLGWLAPHEAGYGRLLAQSISLPKTGVCRARLNVEEQLTGQERIDAAARHPALSGMEGATYWGHPVEIYSDEVRPL